MVPDLSASADEIRSQVNKICQSDEIRTKNQLCKLLRYIVDEALAGKSEHLKGYNIALEVFDKGNDFNPDQDPLVRIHAGRLRRMLKIYYLESGAYDPIIIHIPKGKYIPVFIPNTAIHEGEERTVLPESKINPTVTVLPFKNLSGKPEKDYFALGFSEEISVELTKFEDIKVIENGRFFETELSESEKNNLLKARRVRFIVEGGILAGDKQVKILVRLTDIIDHVQIWAERYIVDYSSKDLMDVQGDIALEVASTIGSEYGIIMHRLSAEANRINPQKTDTYFAILKFHYFQAVHTPEAAFEAFTALEEAIAKEPDSGIATALLSGMCFNRYMLDVGEADKMYQRMNELADRAVELDANSLSVKIVCVMKHFANNDKARFFDDVETCLKKNLNNSYRLGALGMYLSFYGEWERGKKILDQVMQSNIQYPLFLLGPTMLYYYRKKEYEEAFLEAEKYKIPFLFWGPMLRVAALGQLNRIDEAKPNITHLKTLKPDFEQKASYLISRFVKEEELVKHILDGIRKAGMTV